MRKFLITAFILLSCHAAILAYRPDSVAAACRRPVTGFYNIEIGRRTDLDTYLSPLRFSGTDIALSGLWTKALPANPEHLAMTFSTRLNYASLLNRPRRGREYDLHLSLRWNLMWQKRLPGSWILGAGGGAGIYGGMVYNTRNSNNPVAAQGAAGISADFHAGRTFRIDRLPLLLSDRLTLPLAGVFFMPEYGESYYEIYLGNRQGLVHAATPANRFGIDNLLSVTIDFGRTSMTVGYRISYQESYANHLIDRTFCNSFVIGVVPGGIGLRKKSADVITPLF